ncbi:glycine zipper 2TM domain-containing protein [Sphingomonas morindae]|uniref:17 kDa surface antigen n=1 Tax=Sphingomonas morindae TaxID=1541170 RepID=A0ABY4X8V2_9SPHN|nr:glycine zipper 2TM domain-containing protein [Sphingomonas morindae]USI73346.1 glycine zipper 2TM domain-containing protein [Sphingomonas morindae]
MRRIRRPALAVAILLAGCVLPGAGGAQYRHAPPPGHGRDDDRYDRDDPRDRDDRDQREDRRPPRRPPGRPCRDAGTGGTIIGAIAGGLLGNGIAGHGDRAAGTLLGGGLGALAGRAIDRDC